VELATHETGLRYLEPSPLGSLALARHRPDAPRATLVAIHGGLDRGSSFTRLSRRLEDLEVIAYDRRGYQRSRSRGPGSLDQHVEDLDEVIAWARPEGPLVLFGHSFGGLVALSYVAAGGWADLVAAYESPLPWILERPSPTPAPGQNAALEAERFFRRVVSDESWEHLHPREQESRRLDGPALRADLVSMTQPLAPFELDELRVPVLYLHGDQRNADYYRRLAQRLSSANRLVRAGEIEGAGHGAHLSHPDHLAAQLRRAMDDVATP